MGLPVVVFPDAEQLVIDFLADRLGSSVHVGSELPQSIQTVVADLDGVVVVNLLDTADVLDFVLKDPALEIGVLAADKASASALARLVSAHIKAMPGASTPGALVYLATEEGFSWEPDEPTGLPQYVITVVLRVRPA